MPNAVEHELEKLEADDLPGLALRTVKSYDGTTIAYQVRGEGPAVVLANGLGGNYAAWRFLFERLGTTRKVLSWDYRGLYQSQAPASWDTLGPAEQARDLAPILEKEGIDRFVLVGWSMGVQVALEVVRAMPERVRALAAVNGVAGRPFDTAFGWRLSRHLIPPLLTWLRRHAGLVGRVTRLGARAPFLLRILRFAGLVGSTIDAAIFTGLAGKFAALDFDLYYATMQALGRHDATDVLERVRVPTVVITGDRDLMTPVASARAMAERIQGARLVVLEGATHYTPVELPDRVAEELERLLAEARA